MPYLLDTDVVIDRLNQDPATVQLLAALAPSGVAISIVTSLLMNWFNAKMALVER